MPRWSMGSGIHLASLSLPNGGLFWDHQQPGCPDCFLRLPMPLSSLCMNPSPPIAWKRGRMWTGTSEGFAPPDMPSRCTYMPLHPCFFLHSLPRTTKWTTLMFILVPRRFVPMMPHCKAPHLQLGSLGPLGFSHPQANIQTGGVL